MQKIDVESSSDSSQFTKTSFDSARDLSKKVSKVALGVIGVGFLAVGLVAIIAAGVTVGSMYTVTKIVVGASSLVLGAFFFALGYAQKEKKSKEQVWKDIETKTHEIFSKIRCLPKKTLRHRFINVPCPSKTAVSVAGKYIHANRVGEGITQKSLVAFQAPMVEDYDKFWRAVFSNEAVLFDLTTEEDLAKGVTKYYPDTVGEERRYGCIYVKLLKAKESRHIYRVKNIATKEEKYLIRYQYKNWKDFTAVELSYFHKLVRKAESLTGSGQNPLWVHCRAGVGRTGTLITAILLKEKIASGKIHSRNLETSLADIIIELRKQRGPSFVQNQEQFELLLRYAHFLLGSKNK